LKSQPKVIARLRKEIEYFSKAIEVTREKHKSEKDFDKAYPKMFAIFNAFIFFRLSFLDIMVLNISYFKTKDELEKQVFAKLLALSFYEFFQDVPRIFGKQFLQSFERYKTPSSESELRYFQRLLNKMKELSIDELKLIRNETAGHKEQNSLRQIETLSKINFHHIEVLCLCSASLHMRMVAIENEIFKRKGIQ